MDGAVLFVFQLYKNNGCRSEQRGLFFFFTGNVLNLFVCFGKFWFQTDGEHDEGSANGGDSKLGGVVGGLVFSGGEQSAKVRN